MRFCELRPDGVLGSPFAGSRTNRLWTTPKDSLSWRSRRGTAHDVLRRTTRARDRARLTRDAALEDARRRVGSLPVDHPAPVCWWLDAYSWSVIALAAFWTPPTTSPFQG